MTHPHLTPHDHGLPEPACGLGYTEDQVRGLVGEHRMDDFREFMKLKATAICRGSNGCAEPYYVVDVARFVDYRVKGKRPPTLEEVSRLFEQRLEESD